MARISQDFNLFAGEDRVISFKIEDQNGYEIDLDGASAIWVLARSSANFIKVAEKTTTNNGIFIEDNKFNIILNNNDTNLLQGEYNYELRMINSEGKQSVVATGTVQVYRSITLEGEW